MRPSSVRGRIYFSNRHLAGAPFGLARVLDVPTPGPWLLAFYYGMFGPTLYNWGSVLVKGILAAERSRRHTRPA